MAEYLDKTGLTYLWSKIKAKFDAKADKTTADALGKRIDNLILSSGTESSAEVVDARTGYDGTAYETLGTSIRTQVSELKEDIVDLSNQNYFNLVSRTNGKYVNASGVINDYEWFGVTDFIKIPPLMNEITFLNRVTLSDASYPLKDYEFAIYDKNKNWLKTISGDTEVGYITKYIENEDACYIRVNYGIYDISDCVVIFSREDKFDTKILGLVNCNDPKYTKNGVYNLPTEQIINSPEENYTGGWLLVVYSNLYNNNNYCTQIIYKASGETWSRFISKDANHAGEWTRTDSIKTKIKWFGFGDSITEGYGGNYFDIASKILNANYTNYGAGATGYLDSSGGITAYQQLSNKDYSNVDLITLAWGINDYRSSKPLGDINDNHTSNTICGELNACIELLGLYAKDATVVIITPLNISEVGSFETNYAYGLQNSAGYTLDDLSNKLIAIANKYNIPYIDMRKESGFTRYNLSNLLLDDRVHPNAKGVKKIGMVLGTKLNVRGY